jgi:hypothetical protein
MILAEFVVDHPVLREVLHRVPDVEIEWEESYSRPDGPAQMLFWITSDDFETVEAALEADPSVENPTTLVEVGDRRLYRVDFTDLGRETALMSAFIEVGGVLEETVATEDGWQCRGRFPDRAAYQRIYQFCLDHDIGFEFGRLFEVTPDDVGDGSMASALTDRQKEALVTAWELGYFDVPRESTLVEVAEELGISDTAVSQRLRRAQSTICEGLFGERAT